MAFSLREFKCADAASLRRLGSVGRVLLPPRRAFDVAGAFPCAQRHRVALVFIAHGSIQRFAGAHAFRNCQRERLGRGDLVTQAAALIVLRVLEGFDVGRKIIEKLGLHFVGDELRLHVGRRGVLQKRLRGSKQVAVVVCIGQLELAGEAGLVFLDVLRRRAHGAEVEGKPVGEDAFRGGAARALSAAGALLGGVFGDVLVHLLQVCIGRDGFASGGEVADAGFEEPFDALECIRACLLSIIHDFPAFRFGGLNVTKRLSVLSEFPESNERGKTGRMIAGMKDPWQAK